MFLQKAQGHLELSFDLTANPSLKNESEKLRLQSMLIYLHTPSSHKVSSFIAIKRPSSDIDLKLDGVFEGSEGHWNIGFHIQYAKGNFKLALISFLVISSKGKGNELKPNFKSSLVFLSLNCNFSLLLGQS